MLILLPFPPGGCPRPVPPVADVSEEKQKPVMSLEAELRTHALPLLRLLLATAALMSQPDVRGQEKYALVSPWEKPVP